MRFGICCGPARYEIAKKYGYDYVESVFSSVVSCTDEEYEEHLSALKKYGFKSESFNGFFSSDMRLTGEGVDFDTIAKHAEKGMQRAEKMGGKIAVIGSGGARKIPDGFDRKLAEEQFCRVLDICGNIAGDHGMKIAIEPLNNCETNFINTVAEGLRVAKELGNKNVGVLADFFQVFKSGETLDAIKEAGPMLLHTHMARANADRCMPNTEEDAESCKIWANCLKDCGYNGRLSLEGAFKPDFETSLIAVAPYIDLFR